MIVWGRGCVLVWGVIGIGIVIIRVRRVKIIITIGRVVVIVVIVVYVIVMVTIIVNYFCCCCYCCY